MSRTRRVARVAAVAALASVTFAAGIGVGSQGRRSDRESVLDEAAARISSSAQRPVSRADLNRAAVQGMLRALDDEWSAYYAPSDVTSLRDSLDGSYSGVGVWVRRAADGQVRVSSLLPGSPAEQVGLRVGDAVRAVDGRPTGGHGVAEVVAMLRGAAGTSVSLQVLRGQTLRTLRLVRRAVAEDGVSVSTVAPGVVRLVVPAFTRGVGTQVRTIVAGLRRQRVSGVLLDLRADPGGLLDEAVGVAGAFLDGGPVVSFTPRGGRRITLSAPLGGDTTVPLVVLVDGGTASAAEVVAAALQDRGRAVLVGSRTFGKGSVQQPSTLADGSALELTVAEYRTPSGRTLDGTGITPDVEVPAGAAAAVLVRHALDVLTGLLASDGGAG